MQRYERLWERLLTLLGTLGEVDATAPGRLRLTVDRHEIEVVMTEAEWDDLVSIPYGSFDGAAGHLLHMVGRARLDDAPYLVYDTYELHACATPDKPVQAEMEADQRRVDAYLREHPGAKVEWRAYPPGQQDEST
jgi:hypothetical protein